jgi:hypothetical protein
MTFDMLVDAEDDTWKELWNQWDTDWITSEYYYNDDENVDREKQALEEDWFSWKHFWIIRAEPFYKLYIQFSQKDFENEFQVDFSTLAGEIDIPVRLAVKDGSRNVIPDLTIDFNVKIIANGEPSVCANQEVATSSVITDRYLAIQKDEWYYESEATYDLYASVWGDNSITVVNVTEPAQNCSIIY